MAIADVAIGIKSVNHWIGGKLVASSSGRSGTVWNPATGEVQAKVDFAGVEEVDQAVNAAKRAFADWRATALSRRAEIMFKLRELVDANRRRIDGGLPMLGLRKQQNPSPGTGRIHRWPDQSRAGNSKDYSIGPPALRQLLDGSDRIGSRGVDALG